VSAKYSRTRTAGMGSTSAASSGRASVCSSGACLGRLWCVRAWGAGPSTVCLEADLLIPLIDTRTRPYPRPKGVAVYVPVAAYQCIRSFGRDTAIIRTNLTHQQWVRPALYHVFKNGDQILPDPSRAKHSIPRPYLRSTISGIVVPGSDYDYSGSDYLSLVVDMVVVHPVKISLPR
jgi:hypothetical protein